MSFVAACTLNYLISLNHTSVSVFAEGIDQVSGHAIGPGGGGGGGVVGLYA